MVELILTVIRGDVPHRIKSIILRHIEIHVLVDK